MQHTKIDYQTGDEVAIIKTCEDETKYFHAGDAKNWVAQWSDSKDAEYMAQDLVAMIKAPAMKGETLRNISKIQQAALKPDGIVSKTTDYQVRVKGDLAWITYLQEDFKDNVFVKKAHELRILEKTNGQWKIVGLSIQKM
jgi:uncharacterized lipoprotein YmbA